MRSQAVYVWQPLEDCTKQPGKPMSVVPAQGARGCKVQRCTCMDCVSIQLTCCMAVLCLRWVQEEVLRGRHCSQMGFSKLYSARLPCGDCHQALPS